MWYNQYDRMSLLWLFLKTICAELAGRCKPARYELSPMYLYIALVAADWITQRAYFLRRLPNCVGEISDTLSWFFYLFGTLSLPIAGFSAHLPENAHCDMGCSGPSYCTCKFCTSRLINCREVFRGYLFMNYYLNICVVRWKWEWNVIE